MTQMILSSVVRLQREIEQDTRVNLVVQKRLTNPDPLIVRAEADLTRKRSWLIHDCLVGCESSVLDIRLIQFPNYHLGGSPARLERWQASIGRSTFFDPCHD